MEAPKRYNPAILLLAIALAFVVLGFMKFGISASLKKPEIEQSENRGKVMVYKAQEIEALKEYARLDIIKDSIISVQDSIKTNSLRSLQGEAMQEELNRIFNQ